MDYAEPQVPRLYGADDLAWIGKVVDVAEQSLGEPWRMLVDRVTHAPLGVHPSHRAAILHALRRVLAAAAIRIGPRELASALWIDLALDRPVGFPAGRPAEAELAAFANLDWLQRCVRRAHDLQLRIWERASELVRTVARHGVIAQVRSDGGATRLDIVGPLALLHSTMAYGRALAALVPALTDHARFELDIRCQLRGEDVHLRVTPPVLLPAVRPSPPAAGPTAALLGVAERLARELSALGHAVEREPPPLASGAHLLFPDLALIHGGRRWLVEVLGFSTRPSIAGKLALYRRAGAAAMLCVDLATAPGCDLEARVCGFTGHVEADDLLASLASGP